MMNIRERINSILPATVTSFELVSDTVPVMHAGVMGIQIWGVFVGQSAGEALWDEMNPPDLSVRLKAFEKNDLLSMDGGPGWLHLDFTNGWIRIVADTWEWEPWSIIFPDIWPELHRLGWFVFQSGVFRWDGGGGVVVLGH